MRDCAGGLRLHPADQVQVARQPKVGDLGAEAMRVAGRRCQQDVACITASQVGAALASDVGRRYSYKSAERCMCTCRKLRECHSICSDAACV